MIEKYKQVKVKRKGDLCGVWLNMKRTEREKKEKVDWERMEGEESGLRLNKRTRR